MRCSVGLPTCMEGMMYPVPFATPDQVIGIAKLAERLGYHSVWGNDHMTTQRYVRAEYARPPNFWEILITYAFVAAETTTLRFGTGMLILPMRRDIVVTAKQLATLDQFSGGRLMAGVGVGAYREEFEALNPNWKVHRGDLVEEGLQALKVLFTERVATWDGEYYQFHDVEMFPKPLQEPLPLYVGGNNPNQSRRAAMYADGWLPAGIPLEHLRPQIERMRELCAENGRDFSQIDIAPQLICYVGDSHEAAVERFKRSQMYNHLMSLRNSTLKAQAGVDMVRANLIGTADEVIEKAGRLAEAGVTHLCGTYFCVNSVDELFEQMQRFAEEVMPQV